MNRLKDLKFITTPISKIDYISRELPTFSAIQYKLVNMLI